MKKVLLLFSLFVLVVSSAFAQYDTSLVSKQSGDTLFVKDDVEFGGSNTLCSLMYSDTLAPATRVYYLKGGGIYTLVNNPSSSSKYRTIIMGPEQNLKTSSPAMPPPIITGAIATDIAVAGGMEINKDLLVKNCDLELGNSTGPGGGWAWFDFSGPNMRLQLDNCIMEHTWWTWVGGPPANESIFFTNDYFVNLDGHTCRRNGGVTDFNAPGVTHEDTLFVENCTHVNTQGTLYKFRTGVAVDKVLFNHNDFIDNAGFVFMNTGDHPNYSVTNNIFVNVQLQCFAPLLEGIDVGEVDPDSLPMGLVNILDDSAFDAKGASFYADKNLVSWDSSLADIPSTLNANKVDGAVNWVSQMITMNSRTEAMFSSDTAEYPIFRKYPHLTNGTWIKSELPSFKNTDVLFGTQLAKLKAYAIACLDTSYETPLASWRQPSNPESQYYTHADWPIPIDLSYTNSDLLTAGLNGFPVGDLDWFPSQYASWKAQESIELASINYVLTLGPDAVEKTPGVPQHFQLQQNYPNPFNPSTQIEYQIPAADHVTLKVFDVLGREVATLVNEEQNAGTHVLHFDGSSLASGVYFCRLTASGHEASMKMVLVR